MPRTLPQELAFRATTLFAVGLLYVGLVFGYLGAHRVTEMISINVLDLLNWAVARWGAGR